MEDQLIRYKINGIIGLCLALFLIVPACTDDMGTNRTIHTSKREIKFSLFQDSTWSSRSTECGLTQTDELSNRYFLGMIENDSIFITAVEENNAMPVSSGYMYPENSRGTYSDGQFNQFYLSAFIDRETHVQEYLNGQLVATRDNWNTYSPKLYWPKDDSSIDFFSYAWNTGNPNISPNYRTGNNCGASFDYELPEPATTDPKNDAENQPDIIFAITPDQAEEGNNGVPLHFYHTLSAVIFKVGSMPDDVLITQAVISLENVQSKGTCTLTHPLSSENIIWQNAEERKTYTETVDVAIEKEKIINTPAESFMMLPQVLKETDASFSISLKIGEKIYSFPLNKFSGITEKWEPNKRYIYTISKSGYVDVEVDDNCTATLKSDVKIQNTGLTTAYIRAAIVGYWAVTGSDGVEEIVASWDIDDSSVGTLTRSSNWSTHWVEKDGFFYHKTPVPPGHYTSVPLFDKYELKKTTGPVSGSKLYISIVSQAIAKEKAQANWPSAPLWSAGE